MLRKLYILLMTWGSNDHLEGVQGAELPRAGFSDKRRYQVPLRDQTPRNEQDRDPHEALFI